MASLYFFRRKIISLQKEDYFLFFIALIPLVPIYFLCKESISSVSKIQYIGFSMIITSFFLFKTKDRSNSVKNEGSFRLKIKDVLFIGVMQSVALVPGISRSGSTMFAASLRRWKIEEAITFSYLLSIPTILGGVFLEGRKLIGTPFLKTSAMSYLAAFICSFIFGLILINWVYKT